MRDDDEPLVETPKRRLIVIEPFIMLFLIAGFPMMTVTSQFMVTKVAESMGVDYDHIQGNNSDSSCSINRSDPVYIIHQEVQAEAASWNMYKSVLTFIPGLIAPIVLGSLADRLGRRLILIMPCIGSIISVALYLAIIALDLPIYTTLFTSVEALFGSMGMAFTGAFAYISDTVPPESRAFRMTILDVLSFSNAAIANLFVGYWVKAQGYFYPLIFVLAGKVLALLYAIFFIPETLKKNDSAKKQITPKDMLASMKLAIYDDGTGRRWKINTLLLSFTCAELITTHSIMIMYEMNSPLCWDSVNIGFYSFGSMMVMCLTMLLFARIPKYWISPEWKVLISRVSGTAQNLYLAFVSSTLMMYFAPLIGSLAFLAMPMIRFLLSTTVGPNEQASAFAVMTVLHNVTMFVGTMASNKIYRETLYILNGGVVFLVAAGVTFLSLLLMLLYIFKSRNSENSDKTTLGLSDRSVGIQA